MEGDVRALHRVTNHSSGDWRPQPSPAAAEDLVRLPPCSQLHRPLGELLGRRASCRRFSGEALALQAVATLLGAAYGCGATVDVGGAAFAARPVPSAGAKYPLELHLVVRVVDGLDPGSYRYVAEPHALAPSGSGIPFDTLADVFLRQTYLVPAAVVLVIAARLEATTARYGGRGYRYVLLEAGHAAQCLVLAAAELGIGALNLGGFLDDALASLLRLEPSVVPLYGLAIGRPESGDRDACRQIG